jgi:hypothetical protein
MDATATAYSRRELAEQLADADVFDGTAARTGCTREQRLAIRLGSTSQFLSKAVARRLGGQSMPLVLVG